MRGLDEEDEVVHSSLESLQTLTLEEGRMEEEGRRNPRLCSPLLGWDFFE